MAKVIEIIKTHDNNLTKGDLCTYKDKVGIVTQIREGGMITELVWLCDGTKMTQKTEDVSKYHGTIKLSNE